MNTKHPNLDKIISQIKTKKNGLKELVDAYDTLKIQQKSANNASEKISENLHKVSAYLKALYDLGFITDLLWIDAEEENLALYKEAMWANKEADPK